jgi:hypothetical protein
MREEKKHATTAHRLTAFPVFLLLAMLAVAALAQGTAIRTETNVVKEKGLTIQRTYRGADCVQYEMDRKGRKTSRLLKNSEII